MKTKKKERTTMIEIEKKLLDDKSGVFKKQILDKLYHYKQWLSLELSKGSNPDKFQGLNKLKLSLESAEYTIKNF